MNENIHIFINNKYFNINKLISIYFLYVMCLYTVISFETMIIRVTQLGLQC